jgi:hypothetical protein
MDGIKKKIEIDVLNFEISLHLRINRGLLKEKDMAVE